MTKYFYKVGDTVWHGCRYWRQDELGPNEVEGWNTEYEPYEIVQITAKRIIVRIPRSGYPEVHLNRLTMEEVGIQYHSRFGEYFFAKKPNAVGDYIGLSVDVIQASFEQGASNRISTKGG